MSLGVEERPERRDDRDEAIVTRDKESFGEASGGSRCLFVWIAVRAPVVGPTAIDGVCPCKYKSRSNSFSSCLSFPRPFLVAHAHTVRLSVMTLTILPAPAISTNFSCQLNKTLITCPPPSPALLDCICEKPVGWGDKPREEAEETGCEVCDIPLYLCECVRGCAQRKL